MEGELLSLLRPVARSFYLTLRALPRSIRSQLIVAYLLARASDTIADTKMVPVAQRLEALQQFRDAILGRRESDPRLREILERETPSAEKNLLTRAGEVLAELQRFEAWDRERIRFLLETIISGQLLDIERFAAAGPDNIVALPAAAQLDDYTYRVAGAVGEFWTHLCCRHVYQAAQVDEKDLTIKGVRFGKGLQLINILRDFPIDLREGRCYLPADGLARLTLQPQDMADPVRRLRARPLYRHYLREAALHLQAGWEYTNALPRLPMRLRLACAWPILIGSETLKRLASSDAVLTGARIKISRREVRRLLGLSVLFYPFPRAWQGLYRVPE